MDETLRGIWPAVLIETRKDGRIDLEAVGSATRYFVDGGVQGVYTADTASEFYTMEFEEWNELATYFRELTQHLKIASGIGCTWTNQTGDLRRVDRAAELGFHNIHLSQPYWIRLNERAQETFWRSVADRAGSNLAVVVYAGSQGQFPLDGLVVERLRSWCPAIAGTKTPGFDAIATNSLLSRCPDLAHFIHETVLVPCLALGAAGNPSSLASLSPRFMVDWYQRILSGQWQSAFEIQRRVNLFYDEAVVQIRQQGYVVDKALAELGGCPGITRRLRPPYQSLPDNLFQLLERSARRHLPECFQ